MARPSQKERQKKRSLLWNAVPPGRPKLPPHRYPPTFLARAVDDSSTGRPRNLANLSRVDGTARNSGTGVTPLLYWYKQQNDLFPEMQGVSTKVTRFWFGPKTHGASVETQAPHCCYQGGLTSTDSPFRLGSTVAVLLLDVLLGCRGMVKWLVCLMFEVSPKNEKTTRGKQNTKIESKMGAARTTLI